jgi:hypothetical protein
MELYGISSGYETYAPSWMAVRRDAVPVSVSKVDEGSKKDQEKPAEDQSSGQKPLESVASSVDIRMFLLPRRRMDSFAMEDLQEDLAAKQQTEEGRATQSSRAGAIPGQETLSEEEQKQIEELKRRDAEVRAHEAAHLAAAGSLAIGGAQYSYQTGPDGKQYAIGGQVNLDTSPASTPDATIAKAQQVQRAALAPSNPSPQDVKVAAQANQMMMEAQRDQMLESAESLGSSEDSGEVAGASATSASVATFPGSSLLETMHRRLTGVA